MRTLWHRLFTGLLHLLCLMRVYHAPLPIYHPTGEVRQYACAFCKRRVGL